MAYKPPQRAGATVFVWADYSLQERERRWQAVRERGSAAGFDCIFVPLGNGIDARYLTQLRCSSVIMPTDGRQPIIIADRSSRNAWVPEPWQTSREWSDPMTEALLEIGMERARIGVAGLKAGKVSHVSAIDGVVNHGAFAAVMRRLPGAKFEDATDVVGFVRYVKSAEEIKCMRKATEIAEAGIDELVHAAHPGLDEAQLYAQVMGRMLELGTEYTPLVLTTGMVDGSDTERCSQPPLGRSLRLNTLIQSEVSAIWGTQNAEEHQPLLLGPLPAEWEPLIEKQREIFAAGLSFLKPGQACAEFADFARDIEPKNGMKTRVSLLGRGAGDDGPVLGPAVAVEELKGITVEKNTLWLWCPAVLSADEQIQFAWGGTVLVTEKGGELLGKRAHGVIAIS